MDSQVFLWVVFNIFVLGILALDLLVLHRKAHAVSLREALAWSCVWVSLALIFGLGIYFFRGGEKALEFLTGYVIEWSLSVDNLFVFLVIFSYFAVPLYLPAPSPLLGHFRGTGLARHLYCDRSSLAGQLSLDDLCLRRLSHLHRNQVAVCWRRKN